jgi:hypothetical protein
MEKFLKLKKPVPWDHYTRAANSVAQFQESGGTYGVLVYGGATGLKVYKEVNSFLKWDKNLQIFLNGVWLGIAFIFHDEGENVTFYSRHESKDSGTFGDFDEFVKYMETGELTYPSYVYKDTQY